MASCWVALSEALFHPIYRHGSPSEYNAREDASNILKQMEAESNTIPFTFSSGKKLSAKDRLFQAITRSTETLPRGPRVRPLESSPPPIFKKPEMYLVRSLPDLELSSEYAMYSGHLPVDDQGSTEFFAYFKHPNSTDLIIWLNGM
jgi:hypothetical protein